MEVSHSRSSLVPILALIVLVVMSGEAMLTAALPTIGHEFSVPGVFESWVLPVVLLVGAAAAPFIGSAGDGYGRKRLLLLCLWVYLAGLCIGWLAQDILLLLASRALQGIGIASFPLAYALIRDQLPQEKADVGIGVISAMYGAGMFLGVILGSFLTEAFSWRTTYLALIPSVLILIVLTMLSIEESLPPHADQVRPDWAGFATLLAALLLGLVALSLEGGPEWVVLRISAGIGAGILAILFALIELRSPRPLVDLTLAGRRPVLLLISIGTLTVLVFLMLLQEMPFLIQSGTGLGLTAGVVGLVLMPGTLCDMVAGPVTGKLVVRHGVRLPCIIGSFLLILGTSLLLAGTLSLPMLTGAWMIFSAGMSMTATATIIAIIEYVPSSRTAEATGLMQSVQTIGGMIGPVLTGIILAGATVVSVRDGVAWTEPAVHTFTQVHGAALLICLVVFGCSLMVRSGIIPASDRQAP